MKIKKFNENIDNFESLSQPWSNEKLEKIHNMKIKLSDIENNIKNQLTTYLIENPQLNSFAKYGKDKNWKPYDGFFVSNYGLITNDLNLKFWIEYGSPVIATRLQFICNTKLQ
jgi:hypothetical protein